MTQKPGDHGWRPTGVHPLAALFPSLPSDDLQSLADDIGANGLIHPIVIDDAGLLIDGRMRLAACEIVGVEPTFEALNGRDASAFIVSANLNRRNMKKGQQAIALAMIYPEPEKGGRGKNADARKAAESAGFSGRLLTQARSILRHFHALAKEVLADITPFDAALKTVEAARQASSSVDAQMNRLRSGAPDIAAMVDDERLTLQAGMAELEQRQRQIIRCIDDARSSASTVAAVDVLITTIKMAMSLSDHDLAMVGRDRESIDLFGGLPDKKIDSVLAALRELKSLKNTTKGG